MEIPLVKVPELNDSFDKDPVKKREDWGELSDSFGMVMIKLQIGERQVSKKIICDWIIDMTKIPELAIGSIFQDENSTTVEIHVEKVSYVIGVLKNKKWNEINLSPELA